METIRYNKRIFFFWILLSLFGLSLCHSVFRAKLLIRTVLLALQLSSKKYEVITEDGYILTVYHYSEKVP